MKQEQVIIFSGIALSLLFEYVPGFADWYGGLDSVEKRLVMVGLVLVIVLASFGLSCAERVDAFPCNVDGAWDGVMLFINVLVYNQVAHRVTKKS